MRRSSSLSIVIAFHRLSSFSDTESMADSQFDLLNNMTTTEDLFNEPLLIDEQDWALLCSSGPHEGSFGAEYAPRPWDVISGRGKYAFNHVGNHRFRVLIARNLEAYLSAPKRNQKSIIVDSVIEQAHDAGGLFIRRTASGFEALDAAAIRDKVGHSFRDQISSDMKSYVYERTRLQKVKQTQQRIIGGVVGIVPVAESLTKFTQSQLSIVAGPIICRSTAV